MSRLAAAACWAGLALGCAGNPSAPAPDASADGGGAFGEALLEASVEVREALRVIALHDARAALGSSEARARSEMLRMAQVPPGFEVKVDFRFVGDVGDAARAMATLVGYDYQESGASVNPVLVTVELVNEPVNVLLREIAAQSGNAVTIDVYPDRRRVHLIRRAP